MMGRIKYRAINEVINDINRNAGRPRIRKVPRGSLVFSGSKFTICSDYGFASPINHREIRKIAESQGIEILKG